MGKLNIAIILPYLHKIEGNKVALCLISQLIKEGNAVTLFSWKIKSSIYNNLKEDNPLLTIKYKHLMDKGKFGVLFALKYQLFKSVDKKITRMIQSLSEQDKHFDLVIVPSNEGKWIGQFLKGFPKQIQPVTMLTVMELHENGMLMSHRNSLKRIASPFFYPIFFILQFFEKARISSFDIISANSMWTGQLLSYFYGINSTIEMNMYDGDLFVAGTVFPKPHRRYIAVSTVSIQNRHRDWIEKLERDGIDIVAFGSRKINSKSYEGFVPDEKLHEILANASATLFLFDYEAFGLIPLESLISGTPVITEPKMGVLTTYRDSKDVHFAESYDEILSLCKRFLSTEKTDEISKRCKNWAEKYSPHAITEKIMSEYEKAREKQGIEQLF